MMFDDIANSVENPVPGKIFNRPNGPDVYAGVPKDYTGTRLDVNLIYINFHPTFFYLFSISVQEER